MSRKPRIEKRQVPSDYAPRYPRDLSADEYRQFLERDTKGRLLRTAAAAGVLSGGLVAQDKDAPSREEQVLAVLRAIGGHERSSWFERTDFAMTKNAYDSPVVVPRVPISFGNSHNGVFDAGRARHLARQMFRAYGLETKPGFALRADGVEARLDGFDPKAKVGFKLRGKMPADNKMFAMPGPESATTDLSEVEAKILRQSGHEIHVADLSHYAVMDGDQFTGTVAYLAGIVAFLNGATDGPDISLDAVLMRGRQRIATPAKIELPKGVRARDFHGAIHLEVDRDVTIPIHFERGLAVEIGARGERGVTHWRKSERRAPTAGTPSMVEFLVGIRDGTMRKMRRRLVQKGEPPVHVETNASRIFTPSWFDASKPFTILVELSPGPYSLPKWVTIGTTEGR